MKMVATSHLRRAQDLLETAKPYKEHTDQILGHIFHNLAARQSPTRFFYPSSGKRKALVVLSSDKGMCGFFNMLIATKACTWIREQSSQNQIHIITIGQKASPYIARLKNIASFKTFPLHFNHVIESAQKVSSHIIDLFLRNEIDECYVLYNHFVSVLSCAPTIMELLPFSIPIMDTKPLFKVEPDPHEILNQACFQKVFAHLFWACAHSKTSEESSRMMAMDHATRNAEEMIERLQIYYNRTRQTLITKELIEIISGAEAIAG